MPIFVEVCPSSEMSELNTLKRQLTAIQAQVAEMRTAAHEANRENPEATEVKILKQQLAKLSGHQTGTSAFSRKSSRKFENSPSGKQVYRQFSTERPTINRPRPSYCFNCGENGHLAVNCESQANPVLVEEKRQLLRAKQQEWDRQNGVPGSQHLND